MSSELSISARPAEREKLVEIGDVVPIVRTSPCTWEYGRGLTPPRFYGRDTFPSTRSSFWLQYGRVRQHLQACDVLLEQINACAAPPGRRPELDMPAGIMRKGRSSPGGRSFRELPAHVVPESPFDVALDLGFHNPEGVHLEKDESGRDENRPPARHPTRRPECEATSSCTESAGEALPGGDARNDVGRGCGRRSPAPGSLGCGDDDGSREWSLGPPSVEAVVVDSEPDVDEGVEAALSARADADVGAGGDGTVAVTPGEGRVSKRSVGCGPEGAVPPANRVHQTPVNFISASYYVERPSKPEASGGGKSATRRTSLCRIEAFVIRSRSARATPMQQHGSKKATAKSVGV